jgi:hypothetical protein
MGLGCRLPERQNRTVNWNQISERSPRLGSSLLIIAHDQPTIVQVKLLFTLLVTYGKHMDIYVYAAFRFVP